MLNFLGKILDSNEREIGRLKPIVDAVNSLEPEFKKLSDSKLKAKTNEFKKRLDDGETLDELLPEAFAAVREASRRAIGQRHFDVQIIGGTILHEGKIAEMRTVGGESVS